MRLLETCISLDEGRCRKLAAVSLAPASPHTPNGREPGSNGKQMKTRVIIEYDLPLGDCVVLRDQEEQRWITCETVLACYSACKIDPLSRGIGVQN